jgi:hypothetical protein
MLFMWKLVTRYKKQLHISRMTENETHDQASIGILPCVGNNDIGVWLSKHRSLRSLRDEFNSGALHYQLVLGQPR